MSNGQDKDNSFSDDIEPSEITDRDESDQQESQAADDTIEREVEQTTHVPDKKLDLKKEIIDWVLSIAIAVAIALVLRNYVFTLAMVKGPSMEPNLHDAESLAVIRLGYKPAQGDIIIFRPKHKPEDPYVKRVVAVPGQTVRIDNNNGKVYVDDEEFAVPNVTAATRVRNDQPAVTVVPPDTVYVLGDNRNNSTDSRTIGLVDYSSIMGQVVFRLWPLDKIGLVP